MSVTLVIVLVTVLVSWRAFGDVRLLDRLLLWPPALARQGFARAERRGAALAWSLQEPARAGPSQTRVRVARAPRPASRWTY